MEDSQDLNDPACPAKQYQIGKPPNERKMDIVESNRECVRALLNVIESRLQPGEIDFPVRERFCRTT